MPDEKLKDFNWRDYIEFNYNVTHQDQNRISEVIDLMFIDRDGDGRIDNKHAEKLAKGLVKQAEEREGGKFLLQTDYSKGSNYSTFTGVININDLQNFSYVDVETGDLIPMTLNRLVFHELSHAGDGKADKKSDYKDEKYAMDLTNAYMKSEFGEPERSLYTATVNADEKNMVKSYKDGMKFTDMNPDPLPKVTLLQILDSVDGNYEEERNKETEYKEALNALIRLNKFVNSMSVFSKDQIDLFLEDAGYESVEDFKEYLRESRKTLKIGINERKEESQKKWDKELIELFESLKKIYESHGASGSIDIEGVNLKTFEGAQYNEVKVAEATSAAPRHTQLELSEDKENQIS